MDKLNFNVDVKFNLLNEINRLKKNPLFADVDITIENLNSCLIMEMEYLNCQKCKGLANCQNFNKGYFTTYQDGEFLLTKCQIKKEEDNLNTRNSLIKTLYMPKNIREARLDNFNINSEERREIYKEIVNFLTNYDTDCHKGLYLYGTFGCGKTYLLGALAFELAKRNINSLLIYFPDLIIELKGSLKDDRFSEIINELKTIDVLMLDDLGSENMTTFVRDEILGPVLNYRMAEGKPVFISSNLTPDQLRTHLTIFDNALDSTKAARIIARLGQITKSINMGRRRYNGNS